jgi:hypothetical protein
MKKVKNLLVSIALMGTVLGLASCGTTPTSSAAAASSAAASSTVVSSAAVSSVASSSEVALTDVQKKVKEAETLTQDQLFQKAADEIKGNTMKWVGTSSRFKKAIEAFKAKLVEKNAACSGMDITKDTAVDGQIYATLLGEIENGITDGYSGALVQDGYQLQKKGIDTGYFVNYIPKEWKDATDTDKTSDSEPFALQYNFKTWMVNNAGTDTTAIDNVWDITADKYKGKLMTMNPTNENVNMDWLIMLTQDKWCDVLKSAFEDASNDNAALDLTAYAKYGEKRKYAYAFIAGYLNNAVFYDDDGKARDAMSSNTANGNLGWIVYSKIASIQESAAVSKKNFTIAALGKDNTDGKNPSMHMKGFGGFMYKHYLQIMPNSPYPYTACAFINFLSTTAAGYKAWGVDIGDYPTMPSINVDRTEFGHGTLASDYTWVQKDSDPNVFSALNDPASSWWTSTTGGNVVVEDPAYIATRYNATMAFINVVLANKK